MSIDDQLLTEMPFASRSSRLLGQLLDGLVTASLVIAMVLFDSADVDVGMGVLGRVTVLASVAYYFLADALPGGQSLGKRWLDMAVIDAKSGEPCALWQSLVRNLLLAMLGPIDWLFIFGERHQRLGDKAAGTIVVEV